MDGPEHAAALCLEDVRRAFDRAAGTYDEAAVVQNEIGNRLLERLDYLRINPSVVVDLGSGTGGALDALRQRYSSATLLAIDLSESMLKRARKRGRWFKRPSVIAADASAIPLADSSVDLLFSNLMLPWCLDLEAVWGEINRVLRPGGALLFSSLGPDTLTELRGATAVEGGGSQRVHPFIDMHDIGDALIRNGITDPVMDAETIQVHYASVSALINDLRCSGSSNVLAGRSRGLAGISRTALENRYPRAQSNAAVCATVEVVYGHGWAGERGVSTGVATGVSGEVRVPLTALRRSKS